MQHPLSVATFWGAESETFVFPASKGSLWKIQCMEKQCGVMAKTKDRHPLTRNPKIGDITPRGCSFTPPNFQLLSPIYKVK